MIDTSDNISDDASSSLGDSAFEVLGDSAIFPFEDEEHDDTTDSLPSTDTHEDTDGDESSDDTPAAFMNAASQHDEPDMLLSDHQWVPSVSNAPSGAFGQESGASSATTLKATAEQSHPQNNDEELHRLPSVGQTAHTRVIYNFDESQTSDILKNLHVENPPSKIAATIHQALAEQRLSIERPFRVLYTGRSWAKEEIIAKVGAALAVPMQGNFNFSSQGRSSRFNVVPVSSFTMDGHASPEVELIDSFGLELLVDECTSAELIEESSGPGTIILGINGRSSYQSRWFQSSYHLEHLPNRDLPDIAIFFCSDDDDTELRLLRHHALTFMERHAIPSLLISKTPLYRRPTVNYTLNEKSIHICLEACGSGAEENTVLKRLPIDLNSFLNIDASQLNRNLACLTGLFPGGNQQDIAKEKSTASVFSSKTPVHGEMKSVHGFSTAISYVRQHFSIFLMFAGAFSLCAITLVTFSIGNRDPIISLSVPEQSVHVVQPANTISLGQSLETTSVFNTHRLSRATEQSTKSIPPQNGVATAVSSIASSEPKTLASYFSPSEQFNIHVIGDSHVILHPPQYFASLKAPPKLFVQVNRTDYTINAHCSKLFDGVYALRLEKQDAYGMLNISIWTESKPYLEQMFEVDFGSPWMKMTRWKGAARTAARHFQTNLIKAQTSVQSRLTSLPETLREQIDHVATNAKHLQHRAKSISHGNTERFSVRLQSGSEAVKNGLDKIMNQLSDMSENLMVSRESVVKTLNLPVAAYSKSVFRRASTVCSSIKRQNIFESLSDVSRSEVLRKAHERAVKVWKNRGVLRKGAP